MSSLTTLYCLFGSDVNTIAFSKSAIPVFDGLTIASLIFFLSELVLTCIGNPDYPFSFFFFLDVVATATLPFDLSFVTASFVNSSVTGASKASRAGTRATRIIRVLRLIRLFRISNLFKTFRKAREDDAYAARQSKFGDYLSETSSYHRHVNKGRLVESEVAKSLSDLASKRVIVLVLSMMFVVPQLSPAAQFTIYTPLDQSGLDQLQVLYTKVVASCRQGTLTDDQRRTYETHLLNYITALSPSVTKSASDYDDNAQHRLAWITISSPNRDACMNDSNLPWLSAITVSESPVGYSELYARLRYDRPTFWSECDEGPGALVSSDINCPTQLKQTDMSIVSSTSTDGVVFTAIIDIREANKADAFLSIYRTLVICVILGIGTYVFSNSAFSLVLEPIERMIQKVEQIRSNPLLATRMHDSTTSRNEEQKLKALAKYNTARNFLSRLFAKRELARLYQTSMETEMLEKTIVRIGGLLAVGFGPAGAEIVARNMASTAGGLNVMLPGKKIEAIFGFIRIEDFAIIAGVLKQRVMLFVNQISDIVHGITDEFHGIINRTDGGGFQVVWKLDPSLTESERMQVCDMAVAACVKMVIAIKRSLALNEYRTIPPIVLKIPKFRVRVSFGMHRGWAIEGAIGSIMKIDPSYLSADVNVAETIQTLNESYRTTTILLTDSVREGCSLGIKKLMRLVDRVHVPSRRINLTVYSVDLDYERDLLTDYEIANMICTTIATQTTSRSRLRSERESRKARKWKTDMLGFLQEDKYFHYLREVYEDNPLFMETFRAAVLNIECGEWKIALRALNSCRDILVQKGENSESQRNYQDGVTVHLISFLESHGSMAPPEWTGSRFICN